LTVWGPPAYILAMTRALLTLSVLLFACNTRQEGVTLPLVEPTATVGQAEAGSTWQARVRGRIDAQGRAFAPVDGGMVASVGRLRARLSPTGLAVETEAGEGLHLVATAFGRQGATELLPDAELSLGDCTPELGADGACIRRAELAREGLTEWWRTSARGLHQGFELHSAPTGEGPIALTLSVEGATLSQEGRSVLLTDGSGRAYTYEQLSAWDALGNRLPTAISVDGDQITLTVVADGAPFPVVIDPILSTADATLAPDDETGIGAAVSAAGDVNGDLYDDVAIGAPDANAATGAVYIFHGSASGLSTAAATTLTGPAVDAYFGWAISGRGDVNNDGYDDLVVGAPGYTLGAGRVAVYLGSASGLSTTAASTRDGATAGEACAYAVAMLPDVNGDAMDDVAFGCPTYNTSTGRFYVLSGTATGVDTSTVKLFGGTSGYYTGRAVGAAGDTNGDGFGDVVVGAFGYSSTTLISAGRAYIYRGSATGVTASGRGTITGASAGSRLGSAVAGIGDVNNDGYADIVIGAHGSATVASGAYIFHGGASGITATSPTAAAASVTTTSLGVYVGSTVSAAGDIDGDGYDDVAIGAIGDSSSAGAVYVYRGSASGLTSTGAVAFSGAVATAQLGWSLSTAGDVDGDGDEELLMSAYNNTSPVDSSAWLFAGSSAGLATTPTAAWSATAVSFGYSLAHVGDLNGDGYADAVVGAPDYGSGSGRAWWYAGSASGLPDSPSGALGARDFGGQFAYALDGAGDVNNDGYDDLLIGAPDAGAGGEAYLYLGSASGPSAAPATTLPGATGSSLGYALTGAGDMNGDGYDDVAVSHGGVVGFAVYPGSASGLSSTAALSVTLSPTLGYALDGGQDFNEDGYDDLLVADPDSGDGLVYAFHGGASLSGTPAATLSGPSGSTSFGDAVAAAGDIDGDGYADAAVGHSSFGANAGRVTVYTGSASGLSTTASTTLAGSGAEELGYALSAAGDVNSDGYADLLVGAPGNSSDKGAASLFEGSAAGLSTTAATTVSGNTAGDLFGSSLGGGGDLNGDSAPDVLLGTGFADGGLGQAQAHLGYAQDDDGDGYTVATDCDDSNIAINPGATEICDGGEVDEDCDGFANDDDPSVTGTTTWYLDGDGDSYGGPSTVSVCEPPPGAVATSTDCNDADAAIHPGATEVCDAAATDEDCDGLADDADSGVTGTSAWYTDADSDGYGAGSAIPACLAPSGTSATNGDCNDGALAINPGATEACDAANTDEDCDGKADDLDTGGATGPSTWYRDADSDGYGSAATTTQTCDLPTGYAASNTDCNDSAIAINPGATEACDAANTDEDCDGKADDLDSAATGKVTVYLDSDSDGYGGTSSQTVCDPATGYVASNTDCNDAALAINPGATEVCDSANTDEDCDSLADDLDSSASVATKVDSYTDLDADGFGAGASTKVCDLTPTRAAIDGDCNDAAQLINPDAVEICDSSNVDEDCDSLADDADSSVDASTRTTWYTDSDSDGYGGSLSVDACDAPSGTLAYTGDCDDSDTAYNPGATESCTDTVNDYNCDGSPGGVDDDGDGFASCEECDDSNTDVNPSATEVCDGVDNDCDGGIDLGAADALTFFLDGDGDGYGVATDLVTACTAPAGYAAYEGDCDDALNTTFPGAAESCTEAVDANCDGSVGLVDNDGDGFAACLECNDSDLAINPDALEVCDEQDNNCDGSIDVDAVDAPVWFEDQDGDGHGNIDVTLAACVEPDGYAGLSDDCDDTDEAVSPTTAEVCDDELDNDCDSLTDRDDSDCEPTDDTGTTDGGGEGDDTGPTADDGGGEDDGAGDAGGSGDTGGGDDKSGCGCASTPAGAPALAGLVMAGLLLARRRRG